MATIANTAHVLAAAGWSGFGLSDAAWASIMIVVASSLTAFMLVRFRDRLFAAVFVWAAVAIAVKPGQVAEVTWVAWAASVAVLAAIVASALWTTHRRSGRLAEQNATVT